MLQQQLPKRYVVGNYVYLLAKAYCVKDKIYKVGETSQTPNARRCQISSRERQKYKVIAYYHLDDNVTETQRILIEHGIKNQFEKNGYEHVQNDFYKTEKAYNTKEKIVKLFYDTVTEIVETGTIRL